jgi:hypothetical protein
MPRTETIIRIFVASPGDVADERQKLEEIVREINLGVAPFHGVRLELVKWETHTIPSIGLDAQDVINNQIDDDYDIFLGIIWTRLGTDTGRYNSGTAEEYYRAKSKWDTGDESVEIMMYFKDEPIAPSKIDITQFQKAIDFRQSISDQGVYYRVFSGILDFESLVRLHLTKKVTEFASPVKGAKKISVSSPPVAAVAEDDVGLLELLDRFEHSFPRMEAVLSEVTKTTEWLTERLNYHTEAAKRLNSNVFSPPSRADVAEAIKKAAIDMEEFSNKTDAIIPEFDESLNESTKNICDMIVIYKERLDVESQDVMDFFRGVDNLRKTIGGALVGAEALSGAIVALPRLTSALNSAKRRVVASLGLIASRMRQVEQMIAEVA